MLRVILHQRILGFDEIREGVRKAHEDLGKESNSDAPLAQCTTQCIRGVTLGASLWLAFLL